MVDAFALDLGLHDRWIRGRMAETLPVGLRAPPAPYRALAWLKRYETGCSTERARQLVGADVEDTVWVGTIHHHLTYGRVAQLDADVGYLHVDNHTDDYRGPREEGGDRIRSSRFTDAIRATGRPVGYLGAFSPEAPSLDRRQTYDWEREDWTGFLEHLPDRLYVSVDMDVFDRSVFCATHSQGHMSLEAFDALAGWLGDNRDIVAADIVAFDHGHPDANLEPYRHVLDALIGLCG